jgi:hypothetical protein
MFKGHAVDRAATQSGNMASNERQKQANALGKAEGPREQSAQGFSFGTTSGSGFSFSDPNDMFSKFARGGGAVGADSEDLSDLLGGMRRDAPQNRDFASVAVAANPSDCSFYVHYTLSEDRTGTQEEVMSRRLAPLAEKSRSNAFMDDSEVNIKSKGHSTFTVSRESFEEYRRSFVSSFPAL